MIADALLKRAAAGRPLRVAVVGAGRFGTTVVAQISQAPGMEIVAIADVSRPNLEAAWAAYGRPADAVAYPDSPAEAAASVRSGTATGLLDASVVAGLPIDVVVEATGVPEVSARICRDCIVAGLHVVNVTVECDVAVGPVLARLAREHGVAYSLTDGDQPGATKRLVDWARTLGFEIIAAGRGTRRHPADRDGIPSEAFERYGYDQAMVERRRLNPKMYNSFRDGTKSQIEMTAVANMTGLVPDVPGMHEPAAGIGDLPRLLRLEDDGGILSHEGVVELANCVAPDGSGDVWDDISIGVFAVIRSDHVLTAEDMGFYGLRMADDGRTGVIFTPYHLCGIETPLTVAEAGLFGHAAAAPLEQPVADVVAVAKRDLNSGDQLDGSGGSTVSGFIVEWTLAREITLLPLALADGVKVKRSIPMGVPVRYADVAPPRQSLIRDLRREIGDEGWEAEAPRPAAVISFPD